jgi:hypothetical protein
MDDLRTWLPRVRRRSREKAVEASRLRERAAMSLDPRTGWPSGRPQPASTRAALAPRLRDVWLLLVTPDAEPLVAPWRAEHDWAARFGIPAHVTLRTPFLPPERWADPTLGSTLETFLPVPMTLARLEDRAGALVILVEPEERLREITNATTRAWAMLPPHKADRATFAYHLTVVRTLDRAVRAEASEIIAPLLPLSVTGTEMWATAGSAETGLRHAVVAKRGVGRRRGATRLT